MFKPAPEELRPLLAEQPTNAGLVRLRHRDAFRARPRSFSRADSTVMLEPRMLSRVASPARLSLRRAQLLATSSAATAATAAAASPAAGAVPPPPGPVVTSDAFALSLEVCLVHLRRPWFSSGLMTLKNWFVPTIARGAFSAGTAPNDTAPLAVLPTACVFIRNLSIKAQWSDRDREQLETSSHLGAFSLVGRAFDNTKATISVEGVQIIAWICQPLPTLPPRDPS
jgi:hypothetical protein